MIGEKDFVFVELTKFYKENEPTITVQVALVEVLEFVPDHWEYNGIADEYPYESLVGDHTRVHLRSGKVLCVRETPEEIIRKIKEAQA